jgi:hypothetical protein
MLTITARGEHDRASGTELIWQRSCGGASSEPSTRPGSGSTGAAKARGLRGDTFTSCRASVGELGDGRGNPSLVLRRSGCAESHREDRDNSGWYQRTWPAACPRRWLVSRPQLNSFWSLQKLGAAQWCRRRAIEGAQGA